MVDCAFDAKVVVERSHGRRMLAWAIAGVIGMYVMFKGAALGDHAVVASWLAYSVMAAGVAMLALSVERIIRAMRKRNATEERVQVSAGTLLVSGKKPFPRVTSAYYQPRERGAATVRISGGPLHERLDVVVSSEPIADDLMRALGFDPARSIARFRVAQGVFGNTVAQTIFSAVLTVGGVNYAHLLPQQYRIPGIAFIATLMLLNAFPSTISVGPDGLLVRSVLRKTFHAYSSLESAEPSAWGVTLVLKSGKRVELRTRNKASSGKDETREALLLRVQRGIAGFASTPHEMDVSSSLARGGRSIEEWMRALDALTEAPSGYRVGAVPSEVLWRVAEDPTADPTARAGAAAALRSTLDDEGRARLRAAAENTAHPKLRIALEAAASTSPRESLEEALLACDEDAEDARSRAAGA